MLEWAVERYACAEAEGNVPESMCTAAAACGVTSVTAGRALTARPWNAARFTWVGIRRKLASTAAQLVPRRGRSSPTLGQFLVWAAAEALCTRAGWIGTGAVAAARWRGLQERPAALFACLPGL